MTTATEQAPMSVMDDLFGKQPPKDGAVAPDQPATDNTQAPSEPAKADQPDKAPAKEPNETPEAKLAKVQKDLSSQAKANLRLGKENAELKRKLDEQSDALKRLESKLDGTYSEPTDQDKQKQEAERFYEDWNRRAQMSREQAVELYGEDTVKHKLEDEGNPFQVLAAKKPWMSNRIIFAEHPNVEAMLAVEEEEVLETFGRDMKTAREKAKALVRDELFKEFTQQHKGEKPKLAPSLSKIAGGEAVGNPPPPKDFSLRALNPQNL
jgi:predicted RNase H-like nuclease (RuvC/YqgF family)